jgi:phosphatidylinositol kinase/protein kinase (PI-3  family)
MPIRLTRQILKVIAPLEQNGIFESSMLHTLRALRENNDLLLCTLDVFIKEPSMDWIVRYEFLFNMFLKVNVLTATYRRVSHFSLGDKTPRLSYKPP